MYQSQFRVDTQGRSTNEITAQVQAVVAESGLATGLCHVFIHHTSASLMLCENADPLVREDLERFMNALVPDGSPMFQHVDEGPDDMPAHVRTLLTHDDLTLPVRRGRCDLGVWQGVYLWEHRHAPHRRLITVTVYGGIG